MASTAAAGASVLFEALAAGVEVEPLPVPASGEFPQARSARARVKVENVIIFI
jgi:hypothetical protein